MIQTRISLLVFRKWIFIQQAIWFVMGDNVLGTWHNHHHAMKCSNNYLCNWFFQVYKDLILCKFFLMCMLKIIHSYPTNSSSRGRYSMNSISSLRSKEENSNKEGVLNHCIPSNYVIKEHPSSWSLLNSLVDSISKKCL